MIERGIEPMPLHPPRGERGVVLVVSLIFLVVLTILALAGSESALFQERMAGNLRDRELAFQSAESAVREAERVIENAALNAVNTWSGDNGLFGLTDGEPDLFAEASWSDAQEANQPAGSAAPPRFMIKHLKSTSDGSGSLNVGKGYGAQIGSGTAALFRITARGTGGSGEANVIIQTHYGRLF
jgi:type IV pilus assembly protein PilX